MSAAEVVAPRLAGAGLLTGWGEGIGALTTGSTEPAAGLVAVPTPALTGERFRRATRECLLAVAAVKAAVADAGVQEPVLAGERTGIVYVSATGYAAANRAFLEDDAATTLHFPYTSPSAVPGEVTIELSIRGPYVNLMGGGSTALYGLWYAARWLADGIVDRVLLLAVEAVHEVRDLFTRARRLYTGPLVEGAACLLLEPGGARLRWASAAAGPGRTRARVRAVLDDVLAGRRAAEVASTVRAGALRQAELALLAERGDVVGPARPTRPGEALAWGPLAALVAADHAAGPCLVTAAWRGEYGAVLWPGSGR